MAFALVLFAIVVGAMAQRVTGMGFALTASPFLVLLLGPFDGVLIVNLCGAISSIIILSRVWRRIDWRRYGLLVVPALLAIVPGSILATTLPGPVLEIGIAVLLIVALTTSLVITRADVTLSGPVPAIAGGFASGFMNATAGIGGPGVTVYAVLTRWEQPVFAATMQPYFVTIGLAALSTKLALSGGALPALELWQWIVVAAALLVGLTIGEVVSSRVSHAAARRAVIVIAYVGGAIALVHGIVTAALA